jgi:hypothetical protein
MDERLASMGVLSRTFDRLPTWAQVIFAVLAIVVSIYCIIEYGFFSFLLKALFSPEI